MSKEAQPIGAPGSTLSSFQRTDKSQACAHAALMRKGQTASGHKRSPPEARAAMQNLLKSKRPKAKASKLPSAAAGRSGCGGLPAAEALRGAQQQGIEGFLAHPSSTATRPAAWPRGVAVSLSCAGTTGGAQESSGGHARSSGAMPHTARFGADALRLEGEVGNTQHEQVVPYECFQRVFTDHSSCGTDTMPCVAFRLADVGQAGSGPFVTLPSDGFLILLCEDSRAAGRGLNMLLESKPLLKLQDRYCEMRSSRRYRFVSAIMAQRDVSDASSSSSSSSPPWPDASQAPRTRSASRQAESASFDDGVREILSPEQARTVVARYPPNEPDAIQITRGDLARLCMGEFLNDSLIDFWLKRTLRQRCSLSGAGAAGASSSSGARDACQHYFFSSFFYTKLRQTGPNEELRRWTRSVNMFGGGAGCWYVPCCEGLHWSLAVICNPCNATVFQQSTPVPLQAAAGGGSTAGDALVLSEDDSDVECEEMEGTAPFPCILFFDSLKCHDARKVTRQLHAFLAKQWVWENATADTGGPIFNDSTIPLITPEIPMQDNSCDCGVFLLQYVQELLRLLETKPVTKSLACSKFEGTGLRTSFTAQDITVKRAEIASALEELRVEQAASSASSSQTRTDAAMVDLEVPSKPEQLPATVVAVDEEEDERRVAKGGSQKFSEFNHNMELATAMSLSVSSDGDVAKL